MSLTSRTTARTTGGLLPNCAPGEIAGVRVVTDGVGSEGRRRLALEARTPDGDWCVRAHLGADDRGQLAITRLELYPYDISVATGGSPRSGISGSSLRELPLGRWIAQAFAILIDEDKVAQTGAGYDDMLAELGYTDAGENRKAWARQVAEEAHSVPLRRGRRGYPDDHYRRIALAYLDLQAQGVSRGIQLRLAEQEHVAVETIRDWLHLATKKQLLSPGTPGRAGRTPGRRLYAEQETQLGD